VHKTEDGSGMNGCRQKVFMCYGAEGKGEIAKLLIAVSSSAYRLKKRSKGNYCFTK
jgi:hypothetical protein